MMLTRCTMHRSTGRAYILAAAPSNAASDLLALRLLKHVPRSDMLRLHAPSRLFKTIPEEVAAISNYRKASDSFYYPTREVLPC